MPSGQRPPSASVHPDAASASLDEASESPEAADTTDATDAGDTAIEWGPVSYDRIRSVTLGIAAVIATVVVAFLASLVPVVVTGFAAEGGGASLSSIDASTIAVGVLLVAAAAISLLPVAGVARSEWAPESGSFREAVDLSWIRPLWLLGGALATVGLFVALPSNAVGGLWPLAWSVFMLPQLLRSTGTTVRVDPTEAVIERENQTTDRSRCDDLQAVVRTRRIDLPLTATTLFVLAYRGNAWYRSTPWLFVPSDRADAVESRLDAVLARGDGPERATTPERVTLALLGSASLVVGLVIAVAADEGAAGVFLALLTAPFSLLFLALAARL
ncbi:hypothetical protein [Halorubrum laminariae]|uniref:Uncharacterized protein n=1 Tax=Halorubrum laminariae TaxID=1433523 RepID=A0ABD6C3J0_9EURY|nr:hypothetical protein [Halorubrum laminariae]